MALGGKFYDFRSGMIPMSKRGEYHRQGGQYACLDEECTASLCTAIVEAAVQDWRTLNRLGLDSTFSDAVRIMIYRNEIVEFFNSSFFDLIMEFITKGERTGTEARRELGIPEI